MADFLLIGPHEAGKTEILRSFTGKNIEPDGYGTASYNKTFETYEEDRSFIFWHWKKEVKGFELIEIGGNQKNLETTIDRIKNKKDQIVLFVFDGTEFIKQLKQPECGGEIYALWKYYTSKCGNKINGAFFVATHDDKYEDKTIEMKTTIHNLVDDANKLYLDLINKKRYDDRLFDGTRFYCINAKCPKQVKEMINSIFINYCKEGSIDYM